MAEKRGWLTNPATGEKFHAWSHVKSIFYNKASNILLKDKLDEMDKLIDEKIKKTMMSNVQVNDQNKVPTSALVYTMQQGITNNRDAVDQLNRDIVSGYLNLNVKTTKLAGVTREVTFSNGIGKVSGTELIGFAPKWGWGIVAAFRMNETIIIPEIAFDGTDYVYKLPQKTDYSGTIWMTALIMGTKG